VDEYFAPPAGLAGEGGKPYVILKRNQSAFERLLVSSSMTIVRVNAGAVSSESEFIDLMKHVLPFPEWSGSNWDIFSDIGDEIDEEWAFPVGMVVEGYSRLLKRRPQLALSVLGQLESLSSDFRRERHQFDSYYIF